MRDVFNVLGPIRGSGYNSVLKLIQIMHDKKYVRRDDSVRPQIYHAVIGEVQTKRLLLKDLLHRVFGDDAAAMMGHILALRKATPSQLAQIRKELDGAGRGKGK